MPVTLTPRYVQFGLSDVDEVVALMDEMDHTHEGWLNFEPAVDGDAVPDEPGFFGLFSGRGPSVPLATWTPASAPDRGRPEPAMVGLQHGAGSKAQPVLAESGAAVPERWRVTQDHPRRGFVVAVPSAAANSDVLTWLIEAAEVLSTVPLTGRWRAVVYAP